MKNLFFALLLAVSMVFPRVIYPTTMIITEIDRETDIVTIRTATGLLYTFGGAEDYEVGEMVSCIMYSSMTPDTVLDDQIISVRYVGWPELYTEQLCGN